VSCPQQISPFSAELLELADSSDELERLDSDELDRLDSEELERLE
jgi:hypothetical protein